MRHDEEKEENSYSYSANWDMVCSPKFAGGLGLKKASILSQALLAKSSWMLLQNEGLMVSKFLRGNSF